MPTLLKIPVDEWSALCQGPGIVFAYTVKVCTQKQVKTMKKTLTTKRLLYQIVQKSILQFILAIICSGMALAVPVSGQNLLDKRVNVQFTDLAPEQALHRLEESAGVRFSYNSRLLDPSRRLTLTAREEPLHQVLDRLLKPFHIRYVQVSNRIVLKRAEEAEVPVVPEWPVDRTLTGSVKDDKGEPLPGATVLVKGTDRGTTTDDKGRFVLSIPERSVTLVVSYVGFTSQEQVVGAKTTLDIVLLSDLKMMGEVVVVGFGTQKKVNLTGAVSQISSDRLENRPVANMGQALQGVIPNLNVSIANGSPNTTPSINVRGGTSFAKNSSGNMEFLSGSPLILVDGIEMDINQLNPEDVESISVLKDAASAAIYGARAAYGVMLVTTKKGKKSERTRISYSNSFQQSQPSSVPHLLDAYTIQNAAINALKLENKTPTSDALLKLDKISAYMANPSTEQPYYMDAGGNIIWVGNTDVYGLAVRRFSPMQKHNLNLSGGSGKTSYYGSLGYQTQDGLYKINTDTYKRYNTMLNVTSEVSDWFSVELRSQYNFSQYTEPVNPGGKGGWWTAMAQEPGRNINMPVKTPANSPVGVMYTDNILSFMDYGSMNREKKETIVLGASPVITPLKGWRIRSDLSFKSYNYDRKQIVPELKRIDTRWDSPTTTHTSPSYIQRWKTHANQYTINAYSDYTRTIGKHELYGLVGFNQEWYVSDYLGGRGENILSSSIPVISQTLGNEYAYDSEEHWAIRGGFYRFTYNCGGKYLFESNGRYDGTSRFPSASRFKFFSSFSGAWHVTNERFAAPITPYVNDLKLRASYGSLGNQNVANYIYIPSYSTITQVQQLFNGVRPVGITPPGLVDPALTWETASTVDFGADMTLFKRLELSFDWYRRTTSDILVDGDKYPAVIGTSAPTKNSGQMKTTGWEFSSKWRDRLENGLSYDVLFTLSDYQSSIRRFDGNPNYLLSTLYAGQRMGEIWGYQTAGIFRTDDEIKAAPSQSLLSTGVWYPGDVRYVDANGDGKIGPGASTLADPGDRRIIGNNTPRFQFGLNTNVSFRGFDLNLFFQGVGKRDFWIGSNLYWGAIAGGTGTWDVYNNSWTPERTDAFFPAYKAKSANIVTQTKYLVNAAYIRLKNVTLGYSLPKKLLKPLHLDKVRVYGSTYNIWEYAKTPKMFDPEVLSFDYPMIRSLAFGLQVSF